MNQDLNRDELIKRVDWYEKKYGPYIKKRGMHNWKNLFKKPTMSEMIVLFMVIMALFLFWSYSHDIEACKVVVAECNALLNPVIPNPRGVWNPNASITFENYFNNYSVVGSGKG